MQNLDNAYECPDRPGIYALVFPNFKVYVGASGKSIRERLLHHLNAARSNRVSMTVRSAIKKYGPRKVKVFFITTDRPFDAEIYSINIFKSHGILLYNMTNGGEGTSGFSHSDITKQKMSVAAKKSWTDKRKIQASETLKSSNVRKRLVDGQKKSWTTNRRKEMAEIIRARSAKLTESNVLDICNRINNGESCAAISRDFFVTPEAISAIKTGKNWSHITGFKSAP